MLLLLKKIREQKDSSPRLRSWVRNDSVMSMQPNFIEPARGGSDKWRSVVAIAVLIASGGFFLLTKTSFVSDVSGPAHNALRNVAGGDREVVKPPATPPPQLPKLKGEMLSAEKFTAQAIIVKDHKTGAVLFGKNEYAKRSLASITKLMSALVILEKSPDWGKVATVISDDIEDTHMYAGDTYTLEDLWGSALVGSSNKAILTLADAVGWPRVAFVERMNEKARELGMADAVFADATGLSDDNQASASDVAILLNEAMKNKKIAKTLLIKEYNLYSKERKEKHHMWSTDWVLLGWIPNKLPEFFGGKTGYTVAAGYNFTMRAGDGKGHLIDVVVLGAGSHEARFNEAKDIAEWVFASYDW